MATVEEQKAAFRDRIKENPYDVPTRMVFSDWLEDHGMDDEAKLQRDWTPEAQRSAQEWFESFVETVKEDEETFTVEKAIQAGFKSLGGGWTTVYGTTVEDLMYNDLNRLAYWQHWQTLTGVPVSEDKMLDTVFSCTC